MYLVTMCACHIEIKRLLTYLTRSITLPKTLIRDTGRC